MNATEVSSNVEHNTLVCGLIIIYSLMIIAGCVCD